MTSLSCPSMASPGPDLMALMRAIAAGDGDSAAQTLAAWPGLSTATAEMGATRADAETYRLDEIDHYVYVGDTALHIAAATHSPALVRALLDRGADATLANRSGSTPMDLATRTNGRGGSGSAAAKVQQALILQLLEDREGRT